MNDVVVVIPVVVDHVVDPVVDSVVLCDSVVMYPGKTVVSLPGVISTDSKLSQQLIS